MRRIKLDDLSRVRGGQASQRPPGVLDIFGQYLVGQGIIKDAPIGPNEVDRRAAKTLQISEPQIKELRDKWQKHNAFPGEDGL